MEDKDLVNVVPQNQKDEGILLSIIVSTWNIGICIVRFVQSTSLQMQ